jgi:hypothetical protein
LKSTPRPFYVERTVSSTDGVGTNEFPVIVDAKNESGLLPHYICKSNSKWIQDLSIGAKTITLSQKTQGKIFMTLYLGMDS